MTQMDLLAVAQSGIKAELNMIQSPNDVQLIEERRQAIVDFKTGKSSCFNGYFDAEPGTTFNKLGACLVYLGGDISDFELNAETDVVKEVINSSKIGPIALQAHLQPDLRDHTNSDKGVFVRLTRV